MLGAMVGDIVGSIYEFGNIKTKEFKLFGRYNHFTDDTVMTAAVAEALLKGGRPDDYVTALKRLGGIYPDAGYGGNFSRWVLTSDTKPYNSWGNGSAMRVSPVAWFFNTLADTEAAAETSAAVTHNHPEGIKGAQAVAAAIYLARTGKSKAEIKHYIEDKYGYDLSRTCDEIRPTYEFDVSCQGSVPEAIIAFLESTGFEDAIRNAISLGGDSDTIGAITGSIAEAYYGIPDAIVTQTIKRLDDPLLDIIDKFGTEIALRAVNNMPHMTLQAEQDTKKLLQAITCRGMYQSEYMPTPHLKPAKRRYLPGTIRRVGDSFDATRIISELADITQAPVDVIVKAKNSSLLGRPLAGAINRAAGPELLAAFKEIRKTQYPDGLPVGQAVATPGFDLPAKWVIHTVGPNWHDSENAPQLLADCFENSLKLASELKAHSIAFPAISAGVYGGDPEAVAKIAIVTVTEWAKAHPNSSIKEIRFELSSWEMLETFRHVSMLG